MRLICSFAFIVLTAAPSLAQSPVRASVKSDGLVYLSGVVAAGPDVTMQTAAAIEKIAATLKAEGSTLANVANVSVVLKSTTDMAGFNTVFAKYWPKDPPARTTIIVDQPLTSAGALVELSVTAIPNGGERIVVQPAGWLKAPGPYSYGIKTGNTLFLAGLVSRNGVDNTNVTGDMTVQTKTVMTTAAAILKEAGMSLADVVSSRVFIADPTAFQTMNNEYRTYFPSSPPARATVKATLPNEAYLIEIAMVAVKDPERKAIVPPNADGTPGRAGANLSPAIQTGRRLYVAGMTGNTPTNKGDEGADGGGVEPSWSRLDGCRIHLVRRCRSDRLLAGHGTSRGDGRGVWGGLLQRVSRAVHDGDPADGRRWLGRDHADRREVVAVSRARYTRAVRGCAGQGVGHAMTSRVVTNSRALRVAVALGTAGVLVTHMSERPAAQGGPSPVQRAQSASIGDLQVLHLQGNVYVLFGAGPNITLSVGPQGILIVNTGPAGMEEEILEVVKKLGTGIDPVPEAPPVPIRFIVNTSAHPDDTGGNEKIQAAAEFIRGGEHILAHEKVLARMSEPPKGQTKPPRPTDAWPTDTFRGDQMKLGRFFNGEGVQVLHVPSAHTDGDSLVWFRYSDVIATGNLFSTTGWPVIDLERGGSLQGIIDGLNLILKTGLSDFRTEGGTMVVPGHGRPGDLADVGFYRDMLTIVRDRIQDGLKRGLTVEQVKAAKPAQGWESRYGSKTGPWTTDMFIETAYKSLSQNKANVTR